METKGDKIILNFSLNSQQDNPYYDFEDTDDLLNRGDFIKKAILSQIKREEEILKKLEENK